MPDVPPGVVTVTSTVPAKAAGAVAVHEVPEVHVTLLPAADPKLMVAPTAKPVPVTVTTVPPDAMPDAGLSPVTVGTALKV